MPEIIPDSSKSSTNAHISLQCVHEYRDMNEAREAAMSTAATTGARSYACTVFYQAGRAIIATSFPMPSLRTMLQTQAATKGTDPRLVQNRPVDTSHVETIRDYLVNNYPNYVLPPLSVTYHERIAIYTTNVGKVRQGFVVIPDGLVAYITDGQHRYLAIVGYKNNKTDIKGALDQVSELQQDSIAVVITIENDMKRIHQDFADMAMTKPLPKSLLTAYDLRDPVNRLAYEVVDGAPLFKGHVDETSKTLSSKSRHVVLSNWLRNLVKGSIAADYFIAEAEMHRYQAEITNERELQTLRDELLLLVSEMTNSLPALAQIATIAPSSPEMNKIPELRDNVLATTAVGLGISGMVLRRIRTEVKDPAQRRSLIRDLFTKVNWLRRDPSNKNFKPDAVWINGGVLDGGSIKAARGNIFTSTARILHRLGLPLDKRMQKAFNGERDEHDDQIEAGAA
jgi:DNA sulfur modification protein DndB